jgi:acetylornithine deacetylase/succinyl-diaminopimelate desuccinylase-like protein
MPPGDTANGRLVAALARLAAHESPVKLVPQTRAYLTALARLNPATAEGVAKLLEGATPSERSAAEGEVLRATSDGAPTLHALMHDTTTITMLRSGVAANVIPGEAEATVDARLLPGTSTDQLLDEVKRAIADPAVSVEMASPVSQEITRNYYLKRTAMPASSTDTDLYKAIAKNAKLLWPQAETVPTLFEAGTDATAWRERGIPVYGIYPYPLNDSILRGMHGNDERISVRSLYEGTDWIYRVLVDVAVKRP